MVLVPELVDLEALAAGGSTCCCPAAARASAVDGDHLVPRRAPARHDWVLVGCHRSREIHRWFYGAGARVDICPRVLAGAPWTTGTTAASC